MPLYEYRCPACGLFSALVPMNLAAEPAACPSCHDLAPRVLSAPRLTTLSHAQRTAFERNEKSAHEPVRSNQHACGTSGNCAHKPRRSRPQRPWMLGH
jgi:putative FmdB family regulatory protein